MSWFSPKSSSRTPLEIAGLERRLRTETDAVRVPLPQGLQRRTLDALVSLEPRRRRIDPFRHSSPVMASVSFGATIAVLVFLSGVLSYRPASFTPVPVARELAVPSPKEIQQDTLASFRALGSMTGVDMNETARSGSLIHEAKSLAHDATQAASAILISMPRQFLKLDDRKTPGTPGISGTPGMNDA